MSRKAHRPLFLLPEAELWHPRNTAALQDISAGSKKKFWWRQTVANGEVHEWESSAVRVTSGTRCPCRKCINEKCAATRMQNNPAAEEGEEWKVVPEIDTASQYEVSATGLIRNRLTGRVLVAEVAESGYFRISLLVDGTKKKFYIHRLVAMAYHPNPQQLPCVDHIDQNVQNNTPANLRWCTHQENSLNRSCGGEIIKRKTTTGEIVEHFPSWVQAAKQVLPKEAWRCHTRSGKPVIIGEYTYERNIKTKTRQLKYTEQELSSDTWKPVLDHPTYQVNTCGIVKNSMGRVLIPHFTTYDTEKGETVTGYPNTQLDGKPIALHLVVARTFGVTTKDDKLVVNHIDGNKLNPRLENLEAVTPKGNLEHAVRLGLIKSTAVVKHCNDLLLRRYSSCVEARSIGGNLAKSIRDGTRCEGFYWYYADDPRVQQLQDCTHYTEEEVEALAVVRCGNNNKRKREQIN